ncbi:MAG: TlpA family protein disulfide reductase [Clostridia bacterium]|nr:TlpA family protein disulfide reductase [Clostridia bacterium]
MKKSVAILLIVVLLLSGCAKSEPGGFTEFETVTLAGEAATEQIFEGSKLTMVNIWATYCGPCISEMPGLAAIAKDRAGSGFQIVGLVTDVANHEGAQADTARKLLNNAGAEYENLIINESMIALLQNITAVPTTVFVNEKGEQVGESYIGSRDQAAWEKIIDELLEKVQ